MSGIPGLSDGPGGPEMDGPASSAGADPGRRVLAPERSDGPPRFLVVKTETCSWCHRTLEFLGALHAQRGDFEVVVLDANADPDGFRRVAAQTRRSTVPQIFLDGGFVGGWNELAQAAKSGKLDAYLDGRDWQA